MLHTGKVSRTELPPSIPKQENPSRFEQKTTSAVKSQCIFSTYIYLIRPGVWVLSNSPSAKVGHPEKILLKGKEF
jgi:hypothetical protein